MMLRGLLCVGVLLLTPGLTGVICGARDARQGALVANLGVAVTEEQAAGVWAVRGGVGASRH